MDALRVRGPHIRTQVGEAWMDSGLDRSELFLSTKLSVDSYGTMEAAVQLEYQLDALQVPSPLRAHS